MLKHIPQRLSPELVKVLMEMGHGDEIVLADANYPAKTTNDRVVRADGIGIPDLLKDILQLFPLDTYSEQPVMLMKVEPGDPTVPTVWDEYKTILRGAFPDYRIKMLARQEFYRHSRDTFAVVQSGESALYGNIILRKGVVVQENN
ncbi:MAG: fucose isomerase [Sporolactobacillus sp.]|jgi:L-fucose mutarotase|nr:fucose isomerase [Sporolactobacillus sp.]